jgi:hypothetical protein
MDVTVMNSAQRDRELVAGLTSRHTGLGWAIGAVTAVVLPNFGALNRNDAARPHQIKIESDAACNKPWRVHAPCPNLEIYDACFVHFFQGSR